MKKSKNEIFNFQVVLVSPEIAQNTGNISRLCVGTCSFLHLVKPISFSLDDSKLRRAGLDHWSDLQLRIHDSFEDLQSNYRDDRYYFFSKLCPKPYTDISFQKGDFLVFGPESVGLPRDLLESNKEKCCGIPLPGPVRSLNIANAVAVVLYEGLRQLMTRNESVSHISPAALKKRGGFDFSVKRI